MIPQYVDMGKWAVIACDQFSAQPDYWKELEEKIGAAPSTMKMILPEVYLQKDNSERIAKINHTMRNYLRGGILKESECFVLTERTFPNGKKRLGLVVTIDLNEYEYLWRTRPIRATEKTIKDRIPPRMQIRQDAPMEVSHILLLMDDRKKSIIEPLYAKREEYKKLYDFDLNMGGGHIVGYEIKETDDIIKSFDALLDPELQMEKYGCNAKVEFVVGDGNHSMATAKDHWRYLKRDLSRTLRARHPARFALVEVANLYDEDLTFEPINRVVFDCKEDLIEEIKTRLSITEDQATEKTSDVTLLADGKEIKITVPLPAGKTIKIVQDYLDQLVRRHACRVEYVHGYEHTVDVAKNNGIGIFMPIFEKEELFDYVIHEGVLPKKSFSIGTAESKKYYIEAKKIVFK